MTHARSGDRRAGIFLAVCLVHFALLRLALLGTLRLPQPPPVEPLSLISIPPTLVPAPPGAPTPASTPSARARNPPAPAPQPSAPSTADSLSALPPIDWAEEAEQVAKNRAEADAKPGFRDLSSLTPQQLDWIKRNHFEPAPPGIAWTHPRFEFDSKSGLPMFWINERCVLVMLLVYCGFGHIQHDGTLFDHLQHH